MAIGTIQSKTKRAQLTLLNKFVLLISTSFFFSTSNHCSSAHTVGIYCLTIVARRKELWQCSLPTTYNRSREKRRARKSKYLYLRNEEKKTELLSLERVAIEKPHVDFEVVGQRLRLRFAKGKTVFVTIATVIYQWRVK